MFIKFTKELSINVDEIYTIKHDTVGKTVRIDTVRGAFEFEHTEYKKVEESKVKKLKCIAEVENYGLINMNLISKYSYVEAGPDHIYTIYFKTSNGEKVIELTKDIVDGLDDSLKTKLEAYEPYKGDMLRRASKDE